MRVGIFTEVYYPEISGVATACLELKSGLEDAGHEVFVFTVNHPDADKESDKANNIYRVVSVPFVFFDERRIGLPLLSDILHKIKKLNLDIIHTQSEFSLGVLGRQAAKRYRIPMVHTYHTLYEEYLQYLKVHKNEFTVKMLGKFIKKFTQNCYAIICPSQKTKDSILAYDIHKNIFVIPTGVDLSKYQFVDEKEVQKIKEKFHLSIDKINLISISRLSDEKRIHVLIEYFAKAYNGRLKNKIRFLIVGDGPAKASLEDLVEELDMKDHIIFSGYAAWDDIQNYYRAGDIFISASKSETQGLTYLEALATNTPILAQKDSCLNHLLLEGVNGKSFDDFESFQEGLEFLADELANNSNFRPGDNLYTRQEFIKRVVGVYQDAIEAKHQ